MSQFKFRVEMNVGQDQRVIEADGYTENGGWLVFYRKPATGGTEEYWRARLDFVVCMETTRNRS